MRNAGVTIALAVLLAGLFAACGERGRRVAQEQRARETTAPEATPAPAFEGRDLKQVLAAFPGEDRSVVEEPDRLTLFTLNPHRIADGILSPEKDRLQTYGITGQAVITDADEHGKLVEALYRGLKGEGAGPASCFWPRHGLRFERGDRTIECLICFECTWIHLYGREGSGEETRLLFGAGVEPVFASILAAHGLKVMK